MKKLTIIAIGVIMSGSSYAQKGMSLDLKFSSGFNKVANLEADEMSDIGQIGSGRTTQVNANYTFHSTSNIDFAVGLGYESMLMGNMALNENNDQLVSITTESTFIPVKIHVNRHFTKLLSMYVSGGYLVHLNTKLLVNGKSSAGDDPTFLTTAFGFVLHGRKVSFLSGVEINAPLGHPSVAMSSLNMTFGIRYSLFDLAG